MVEGPEAFNRLRAAMKTILSVRKSDLPKKQSPKKKSVRSRASRGPAALSPS